MLDLDELIHQACELKPLPASAVRLAALTAGGHADLSELSDVIAYDQALTLKLLRAANAAASGGSLRVTTAEDAVFRLGTARVLALAVASGVSDLMKRDVSAYGLGEGDLWRHSVAAATAAEVLPEFVEGQLPPETFTAALLHDVGKLVIGRFLSTEDLDWMYRAVTDGSLTPLAAECEVLNVHHGELGGIIAQHWQLPDRIVQGIIHHHTPTEGRDVICDAVHLANVTARHLEGKLEAAPEQESLERLGLPEERLEQLITAARSRFESVSARYRAA
jgi:HD-like signal output (HDOD) protein